MAAGDVLEAHARREAVRRAHMKDSWRRASSWPKPVWRGPGRYEMTMEGDPVRKVGFEVKPGEDPVMFERRAWAGQVCARTTCETYPTGGYAPERTRWDFLG